MVKKVNQLHKQKSGADRTAKEGKDSMKKYTKFTKIKRLKLEALYNAKIPVKLIAKELGFTVQTIYREIKRGTYEHLNSDYTYTTKYSADIAQRSADFENTSKGAPLKIGNDREFIDFVEEMILVHKYSPEAIIGYINEHNLQFKTKICRATLYNYIDQGIFLHVTNKNLLRKGKKKRKYRKIKHAKRITKGKMIEERPKQILERNDFGHWELDTVIGARKKGETLLCMTERRTRMELIFKSKDKSAASTVNMLNKLERKLGRDFSRIFKTITCDNGVEFANYIGMEQSCLNDYQRTAVYYCHPYCSSERGSNENQNGFIRRFVPKGVSIKKYTNSQIKQIQDYINTYPRGIFNFKSSLDLFKIELEKINSKKINIFF